MPDPVAHPDPFQQLLPPTTQEALGHLQLVARRAVDGLLHGLHQSRRLGVSTAFDHHKNYQPGDPRKHIDWKVSARHDRLYVKRYLEDMALRVLLVVDRSASMLRATDGRSKDLYACQLAAALAYLTINQRDLVGLITAAAGKPQRVRAGSSQKRLVELLTALVASPATGPDGLGECLAGLAGSSEPRSLVVVISDFLFEPLATQRRLAPLQAQGHEVLLLAVRDPVEQDFPFQRWVEFADLENPGQKMRLDALVLQRIYREEFARLDQQWQDWARKHAVHWLAVRTDANLETALTRYCQFRAEMARA